MTAKRTVERLLIDCQSTVCRSPHTPVRSTAQVLRSPEARFTWLATVKAVRRRYPIGSNEYLIGAENDLAGMEFWPDARGVGEKLFRNRLQGGGGLSRPRVLPPFKNSPHPTGSDYNPVLLRRRDGRLK